jgi:hypothetical protein
MTHEDYRKHATECIKLAAQANELAIKLTYIGMARAWLGLADLADRNNHTDIVYETSETPQKSSHAE